MVGSLQFMKIINAKRSIYLNFSEERLNKEKSFDNLLSDYGNSVFINLNQVYVFLPGHFYSLS